MCGINGFIQKRHLCDREELYSIVHNMNETIVYRGPDSEGLYADDKCALGMRRLSVIDVEGGNQPIWNDSKSLMIVYNGEIYNYRFLKRRLIEEGCIFHTNSDTEVVLKGYEKHGTEYFAELEGMFAICLYDKRSEEWILARDKIGEKPLYYYHDKDCFVFGSELKSLLITGYVPKKIDYEGLCQFFQLTYIPAPYTIIDNVKKLMPATYLIFRKDGSISSSYYWKLALSDERLIDYESGKKALREAFLESVEKRMISDVPLGAFLSGGFDSTVVVGAMSYLSDNPIKTFTVGLEGKDQDESGMAALVAKKHHTDHTVLKLDWNKAFEEMEDVLEAMGEPLANPTLIATYQISKLAKEFVTVCLTGDAGDELFAGYDKYLISYYSDIYNRIPKIVRKFGIEPLANLIPKDKNISRKILKVVNNSEKEVFGQRKNLMCLGFKNEEIGFLMRKLSIPEMQFIWNVYNEYPEVDEQKRAQYLDLKIALEGCMLSTVDRGSMLASLETRIPMLDSKIIELVFSLPTEYKIRGKQRKRILKDAFRDMIPDELYKFPKHGFGVPIGKWIKDSMQSDFEKYINKEYLNTQGLFSYEYIKEVFNSHLTGKMDRGRELWSFFVFQNWYERNMT